MWLQHKKKSYYIQIFCQSIVFFCVSFFLYIFSSIPELKSSVRYRWPWEISPSSKATSSSHGDNSFIPHWTNDASWQCEIFQPRSHCLFFLLSAPRPCKGKGPGNEIGDRSQVWPKWWVNKKVKICVLSQRQTVVSFCWDQDDYSPKNSFFDICPSLSLSFFLRLSSIVNSAIRGLSYRNENIKLSFTIFNY